MTACILSLLLAVEPGRWSAEVALLQEAVGMPGLAGADLFTTGPHPGLVAGLTVRHLDRGWFSLHQTARLGGFLHGPPRLDAFFLSSELVPRATFGFGLALEGGLGLGVHQPIDRPGLLVSLRVGLAFRPPSWPLGVFTSYQVMAVGPTNVAPILPRSLLQLGVTVPLALR